MEKTELISLVYGCQHGNPDAQNALVLECQNHVYYQCLKFLKRPEDAQDAAQEILISVLTKINTLMEPEAFWGWLNRIAANHCKNLLRGKGEIQLPENEDGSSLWDTFETLDQQTIPHEALDHDETRRMIVELVYALPALQRMCVIMHYYNEMQVAEIADALEVSENTIKSRLHYARQAIKSGVVAYEKQGIKLYTMSPLPLLAYFLRQDAELCRLPDAEAQRMANTVLASWNTTGASQTAAANNITEPLASTATLPSQGAKNPSTTITVGTAKAIATAKIPALGTKLIAAGLAAAIVLSGGALLLSSRSSRNAEMSTNSGNVSEPNEPPTNTQTPSPSEFTWRDLLSMDTVCYAKLLDFDADGNDELLVGLYSPDGTFLLPVFDVQNPSLPLNTIGRVVAAQEHPLLFYRHSESGNIYLGYYTYFLDDIYNSYEFSSINETVCFRVIESETEGPQYLYSPSIASTHGVISEVLPDVFFTERAKFELIEPLPFQSPPDPSEFRYTVEEVRQQLED